MKDQQDDGGNIKQGMELTCLRTGRRYCCKGRAGIELVMTIYAVLSMFLRVSVIIDRRSLIESGSL